MCQVDRCTGIIAGPGGPTPSFVYPDCLLGLHPRADTWGVCQVDDAALLNLAALIPYPCVSQASLRPDSRNRSWCVCQVDDAALLNLVAMLQLCMP